MNLTIDLRRGTPVPDGRGRLTHGPELLTVQWPITDPSTPLVELIAAASHDLTCWLIANGWAQAGPAEWSIGRAAGRLTWRVSVAVEQISAPPVASTTR